MTEFQSLDAIATHLRNDLAGRHGQQGKNYALLYAYNGTGKTRLSMLFKELGKQETDRDTLYFNAFTEDLFTWHNDIENDSERYLVLNVKSRFFAGLQDLEMDTRIRQILQRYAGFNFRIETEVDEQREMLSKAIVRFQPRVNGRGEGEGEGEGEENIKVSRGEENLFIWCFFLAVVQLAMDDSIEAYSWVRYLYIDDPISSLDENNAVAVAHHLAQILKSEDNNLKTIISSHHTLFFNVCWNELKSAKKYFLSKNEGADTFDLKDTGDTPTFFHVALLAQLHKAAQENALFTYHFSMLRILLEKAASFHGFTKWSDCIQLIDDDPDGILYARIVNIMTHGNYSHYEPREMGAENKGYFKKILKAFTNNYKFNPELFSAPIELNQTAGTEA